MKVYQTLQFTMFARLFSIILYLLKYPIFHLLKEIGLAGLPFVHRKQVPLSPSLPARELGVYIELPSLLVKEGETEMYYTVPCYTCLLREQGYST